MFKKLLIYSVFIFTTCNIQAQSFHLSDSAQISLLTNSPWNGAVYSVFGHTAIRVCDKPQGIDVVFNYGVFDFNAPNFIFRFVKGETDYMVLPQKVEDYILEYQLRGVATYEQILNISQQEKQNIWKALYVNSLPENREYRYNFFFDNCSTRPRDIIEDNIEGNIKYTPTNKNQTFRDLVHECVSAYPWLRFGIDLVIGSDADKEISDRDKMFLPIYLKNACENAVVIQTAGLERKLVLEEMLLTENFDADNENATPVNYPLIIGCLLLSISVLVSIISVKKSTPIIKLYDIILFVSAGVTGCLIAFLVFFSEHPAVAPNWNLVWLNPIQLIVAFLIPVKYFSKGVYYYHFINFALLSIFLLLWYFIPQYLEVAFIPFILSIWVRSGTNFAVNKWNNNKRI